MTKRSGTTGGTSGGQGTDTAKQNLLLSTGPTASASASKVQALGGSHQTLPDGGVFTINSQSVSNVYIGQAPNELAGQEMMANRNNRMAHNIIG